MRRHLPLSLAAAALLAMAPLASAQAQIGYGALVGGSLANITGDLAEGSKNTTTMLFGGFLNVPAGEFAIQPGLLFTRKGFAADEFEGVTPKTTFDYLQIPVVARIGMPVGETGRFYIGVGPAVGIKIGCRISASGGGISASTNCDDLETDEGGIALKSTEISGIGEVGLEFGKFSVGLRGDLGLTDIYEASSGSLALTVPVKTRTISAVFGIRF
jgi:hypothetical protein